jgi:hypothetical protein
MKPFGLRDDEFDEAIHVERRRLLHRRDRNTSGHGGDGRGGGGRGEKMAAGEMGHQVLGFL